MKRILFFLVVAVLLTSCGEKVHKVEIQTEFGNMEVELFNSTPLHRDNFVKLVKEGYYDDLLFHRIIRGFMVQGGDPNSKGADLNTPLGGGGPGYTIPAEIGEYHFKGRLAAARTPDSANPQRNSSGSQFYICQGRTTPNPRLEGIEATQGIKYSAEDKQIYNTIGGTPELDNQYTVFGQVTKGLEIVDQLAAVQTGQRDRPAKDVKMKIRLIN